MFGLVAWRSDSASIQSVLSCRLVVSLSDRRVRPKEIDVSVNIVQILSIFFFLFIYIFFLSHELCSHDCWHIRFQCFQFFHWLWLGFNILLFNFLFLLLSKLIRKSISYFARLPVVHMFLVFCTSVNIHVQCFRSAAIVIKWSILECAVNLLKFRPFCVGPKILNVSIADVSMLSSLDLFASESDGTLVDEWLESEQDSNHCLFIQLSRHFTVSRWATRAWCWSHWRDCRYWRIPSRKMLFVSSIIEL